MNENKSLNEGTWEFKYKEAENVIKMIEELKTKIYSLVGDDILFDFLDNAVKRVEELKNHTRQIQKNGKTKALNASKHLLLFNRNEQKKT